MQIENEQDDRAMWIAFCAVKFIVPKKYGARRYYVQFKNCLLQKGILLMMALFSKSIVSERSFESLNIDDLRRLSELALRDLNHLFTRKQETGERYKNRLMLICLCQGAAEHFIRPENGIKDFDVWAFFEGHPEKPFPYRRRGEADFSCSRFGRHPNDFGFEGRRVDILGRSIQRLSHQTPVKAVQNWVHNRNSKSSCHIAQNPVIVIHPEDCIGLEIWDPLND